MEQRREEKPTIRWRAKRKNNERKRKEEQKGAWRKKKRKEKKEKNKVVQIFLRSVARELKLVYSTRATSRYQERKDSVLHVPRGRGFSYSGSFSFKGHKWPYGLEPTTGLSLKP